MLDSTLGELNEFENEVKSLTSTSRTSFEEDSKKFLDTVAKAKESLARPAVPEETEALHYYDVKEGLVSKKRKRAGISLLNTSSSREGEEKVILEGTPSMMMGSPSRGPPKVGDPLRSLQGSRQSVINVDSSNRYEHLTKRMEKTKQAEANRTRDLIRQEEERKKKMDKTAYGLYYPSASKRQALFEDSSPLGGRGGEGSFNGESSFGASLIKQDSSFTLEGEEEKRRRRQLEVPDPRDGKEKPITDVTQPMFHL